MIFITIIFPLDNLTTLHYIKCNYCMVAGQAGLVSRLAEKGFQVEDHGDIAVSRLDGKLQLHIRQSIRYYTGRFTIESV